MSEPEVRHDLQRIRNLPSGGMVGLAELVDDLKGAAISWPRRSPASTLSSGSSR